MVLCPKEVYCPSDEGNELFLQREPFEGEQWAPAVSKSGANDEYWVSIGSTGALCSSHEELPTQPQWTTDGSRPELKEHTLCCLNPKYTEKESSLKKDLGE